MIQRENLCQSHLKAIKILKFSQGLKPPAGKLKIRLFSTLSIHYKILHRFQSSNARLFSRSVESVYKIKKPGNLSVFVSLGYHNNTAQTGWPEQQRVIVSQFWRRKIQDQGTGMFSYGESFFLGLQMTVSSHGCEWGNSFCCPSYEGTKPIRRTKPSNPNYLPKTPLPNTITLGVRASTYECGGTHHSAHRTAFLKFQNDCDTQAMLLFPHSEIRDCYLT